jgi:hypothetical protein
MNSKQRLPNSDKRGLNSANLLGTQEHPLHGLNVEMPTSITKHNVIQLAEFLLFAARAHFIIAFWVNGTALPEVDFDIGESYAGNLANTPSGNSSLFFWFFPSDNPDASDEVW